MRPLTKDLRLFLFLSLFLYFFAGWVPCISKTCLASDRLLDIQEVESPGGVKAWLVEDHTLPIVAAAFSFKGAGSDLEPADRQGLARLVSNMLDEGAGPYDSQSFQKILNDNSISLGFSSGRDDFGGSLHTLTKNKALAFTLLHLALSEPRFDAEPLERMRAANLTRIRAAQSDPEWMAARLLNDVAFAGHPYALNSGGTLTTLQKITAEDLRAFASTTLARDNLRVSVAGDITAKELGTVLDAVFGDLPEKADVPPVADLTVQNAGQTVLYKQDIPQAVIETMQPGLGRTDPDYYTGMVMNFILGGSGFGSRLTEEVREKRGLAYGINSSFYDMDHFKGLSISTSTKNESVGDVLDLVRAELKKMRDAPVTAEELASAKSYLIGAFPLELSSTGRIAGLLLDLQLDDLPVTYLDERAEKINKVTAAGVQALAQRLLTPDSLTTVIVGQPEGITPTKIVETLPNVD